MLKRISRITLSHLQKLEDMLKNKYNVICTINLSQLINWTFKPTLMAAIFFDKPKPTTILIII